MISIAIDGPSGSGKSSISKCLAKKLGFVHVDTGALYRTIAYHLCKNNVDYSSSKKVCENLKNIDIKVKFENNNQNVFLNGVNVTDKIRSAEISMVSSRISSMPLIRKFLLDLQRNIAKENNVIMDGRDIATVVLPNSEIKIFLTASPEVRAKRRYNQMVADDPEINFSDILKNINERDFNDTHREISPLKISDDAIVFDNSDLTFDQTVNSILKIIKERINFETK